MPYLSASAVVFHYEEALYQVYAPLPLPFQANINIQKMLTPGAIFYLKIHQNAFAAGALPRNLPEEFHGPSSWFSGGGALRGKGGKEGNGFCDITGVGRDTRSSECCSNCVVRLSCEQLSRRSW